MSQLLIRMRTYLENQVYTRLLNSTARMLTFASIPRVHRIRTDCTIDGSGNCTLQLTNAVAAADSPADNAAVTVTDSVEFIVRIAAPPIVPDMDAADFVDGYRLVFQVVVLWPARSRPT